MSPNTSRIRDPAGTAPAFLSGTPDGVELRARFLCSPFCLVSGKRQAVRHAAHSICREKDRSRTDTRAGGYRCLTETTVSKGTGPGALSLPGTGHRFEQFFIGNKKDAKESARGKHHEVRESGDAGRGLPRVPHPPEFPCELCAKVPGHFSLIFCEGRSVFILGGWWRLDQ